MNIPPAALQNTLLPQGRLVPVMIHPGDQSRAGRSCGRCVGVVMKRGLEAVALE